MKIILTRDARIKHRSGEIVEVSPDEYKFLASIGAARPVVTVGTPTTKRKAKK